MVIRAVYLPGHRFGHGVVIDETRLPVAPADRKKHPQGRRAMRLRCDCGSVYVVTLARLASKTRPTLSCGCLQRRVSATHGLSRHPLYGTWNAMLDRCESPAHQRYADYGGRGIAVCDRWHDVRLFIEDILTDIGPRPTGHTLDRIDNNGNYERGKVRWATYAEQAGNRRRPKKEDD